MEKYTIGIDFGTESGRVIIANVRNGNIKALCVIPYTHGVITQMLPIKQPISIPHDFALQHPGDYLEVLYQGIPKAISGSEISPDQIIGIGIDFTSSTMIPTDQNLKPLCFYPSLRANPHSWAKLWKHHGPKHETNILHDRAIQVKPDWLKRYGFNISREWLIPKCFEVLNQDEFIYNQADLFLEAGDWIVAQLTGQVVRSNCSLGFKALWHETKGFPETFLSTIHPELGQMIHTKLRGKIGKVGECAGYLTTEMATKLGLPAELPVGVAIVDAHSAVLGTGVADSNRLAMVMGTSTCHMMLNEQEVPMPGISGIVKDAIVPGFYAYESGQSAVGDLFGWYANQVPFSFADEANKLQISVFDLLEKKAQQKKPGESGLIALDWHNGNRSILSDSDLTGLIVGLTLTSQPEDIYRAYMEATAFGAKIIVKNYEEGGIQINDILACGGLPQRNECLMQIYADVLNHSINVFSTEYAPAIGAAMLGATAAGKSSGGFDNVHDAVKQMQQPVLKTYHPIKKHVQIYEELFNIYKQLHNHFGYENIMKKLKSVSTQIQTAN
ncbi:ribulokinase [Lentibacillus sp. N15]|uniref:ribulokinase n=1 Tax=Lentibacillus songyuanensis TaxID=3136161 RepID=UPI0031BB65E4